MWEWVSGEVLLWVWYCEFYIFLSCSVKSRFLELLKIIGLRFRIANDIIFLKGSLFCLYRGGRVEQLNSVH
jgi:hypothetical protein